jgi:hypothetical protein
VEGGKITLNILHLGGAISPVLQTDSHPPISDQ